MKEIQLSVHSSVRSGKSVATYKTVGYSSVYPEKVYELIVTLDNDASLTITDENLDFHDHKEHWKYSLPRKSGTYHLYFRPDREQYPYEFHFLPDADCCMYKISEVKLREWEPSEIFERLQSIDNEGMRPKETALESKVSNISAKFDELSDFLKTFTENDMSHVNGENIEKIGELESLLQSYDERLSAMVGKYVRIVPECQNYFNADHEAKTFSENDVLKTAIYTVKAYQSGLYTLSSPQSPDILVSFEMVTRV